MKFNKILLTSALLSFSGLSLAAMNDTTQTTQFSADQVKQIQQVVHDYLVNNPKVLIEASQALQKQEIAKVEQKAKTSISENANQIFADPASPVVGNPQGDVSVVEFFDYQCPHCKDMGPVIDNIRSGDPNLRVVLKELPIFGGNSKDVSMLALAAQQQSADKYAKFHAALLAAPNPLSKDKAMQIAKTVGLDTDKLAKDMNSDAVKKQIDDNFKLAQSLGLMGTPTLIVSKWQANGKDNMTFVKQATFIPGVVDEASLKEIITQTRKS